MPVALREKAAGGAARAPSARPGIPRAGERNGSWRQDSDGNAGEGRGDRGKGD